MRVSLVIASTLVACFAAHAQVVTYNLSYTPISGSGSLTGNFTIDTSDPGATQFESGLPAWFQSLNLTYTPTAGSPTTYTLGDFNSIAWSPNGGTVNWNSDLVPQFSDINFFGSHLEGVETFTIEHLATLSEFQMTNATPVPEPSQWAGAAGVGLGAFALIRRRMRPSKTA